jgi:hypothetical protein
MMATLPFKLESEKEWLRKILRNEIIDVTFLKKDGSERKMQCTLLSEEIPTDMVPKGTKKTQSTETIAVFDVENQGWRSFRWDSIKQINLSIS